MRDSYSFDEDYTGMKEIIYLLIDPAIPALVMTGRTSLKEKVRSTLFYSGVTLKMIEPTTRTSLPSPIFPELSL